jgi:hypothetical protein
MKKLCLQLVIWALAVGVVHAQSTSGPTARLVIRSGTVEVQRANGWVPIAAGEIVNPGERIRTGTGSRAAVEIEPGKVVTLNESSEIQLGLATSSSPLVQLEGGSMKVISSSNIQVAAKDTKLESTDKPVDLELGYEADKLNLTIFNGAVRNGPVVIHGGTEDPNVRTYSAGTRPQYDVSNEVPYPTFYIYPYFLYGHRDPIRDPNEGKIVPPVVNNPTNPGYRPTQIVPPMSDPIRVPVTGR